MKKILLFLLAISFLFSMITLCITVFRYIENNIHQEQNTVVIRQVVDQSPAMEFGLKQGDILISYKDKKVTDPEVFLNEIKSSKETEANIVIQRQSELKSFSIPLSKKDGQNFLGVGISIDGVKKMTPKSGLTSFFPPLITSSIFALAIFLLLRKKSFLKKK